MNLGQVPLLARIAIVLTVGITVEIIFRGFAFERLATLIGSAYVAGVISWLMCTLAHFLRWRFGGATQVGTWAAAMTVQYVRRYKRPTTMLMHALDDAIAFIVLPMLRTARRHNNLAV